LFWETTADASGFGGVAFLSYGGLREVTIGRRHGGF